MSINLLSNEVTVHHSKVEWDVLREIIAQFAYFESTKQGLTANLDRYPGWLESEFTQTERYSRELKDDHQHILRQLFDSLPADDSLARYIGLLEKAGVLTFAELNRVTKLLEAAIFLKGELPAFALDEFERINAQDFQPLQRKFLREFRHLVDSSGEVHFDRHPELAELTRRLRELEERVRRTVQDWLNEPAHTKIVQYNGYDVHYDRFVVPVRSDSYRADLGQIVSRSDSGQTLFVEPFEVREACNRRLELIAKIDEIISQLARKFSLELGSHGELLKATLRDILWVDHYLAKSSFAQAHRLARPTIREKPGFIARQLFHPLLKNPVKNDVECAEGHHGIVISGPNTGGKTVFLKSIALTYLLFNHGFFVPAQEAELWPYQGIFYFGNDLQDLGAGLSSFSGEVKNYIHLLENVRASNLVLIDEIFNSTSSDEASALSLSYFNELHRRSQCHIVVSTHHQMFKTLVHQDRNYISCHVGFDTQEMKPTYKIQWGTPGSSMAIDIFRILSADHPLVSAIPGEALQNLNSKTVSYETLLQRVSQKQIELDRLLTQNRQLEVELKNQKGAMEGVLGLKLQEEVARARKEISKITDEARLIVEQARRQEISKVRRVQDRTQELHAKLEALKGEAPVTETTSPVSDLRARDLNPGDLVQSLHLKKEFTVISVDPRRDEVMIGKGPIKITVPANTLFRSRSPQRGSQVTVNFQKPADAKLEYDVRGMRLSEFQNMLDKAIGNLISGDVPYLSIIHGHGDGVLKNWLRDYLRRSKDLHGELPESGNDGETKITLK